MPVEKTSPAYLFARALPILFSYTGPLCFAYFAYFVFGALSGGISFIAHPFPLVIDALGLAEIVSCLLWFLPYREFLQARQQEGSRGISLGKGSNSRTEGLETFLCGVDHTLDLDEGLHGWTNRAHAQDIWRDNVKE